MKSSNINKQDNLFEYHKHNLVYLSDQIKFADTKAGIALGITSAILAFSGKILKSQIDPVSLTEIIFILGIVMLIISFLVLLLKVVWPRYTNGRGEIMSWSGISFFAHSSYYNKSLKKLDFETFIDEMALQNYALAVICKRKYKFLRRGYIFLLIGASIVFITWFFL